MKALDIVEGCQRMPTRDQLIYLAGLMDGEGTFSIQINIREYKGRENVLVIPRMSMSLKYGNAVLDELVQAFGGKCYDYPATGMRKWALGRRALIETAARALLPHLRIKHRVCERFLEALALMPDITQRGHKHFDGERSWSTEQTLAVADIAFTLNPGGKRAEKARSAAAYINRLRAATN